MGGGNQPVEVLVSSADMTGVVTTDKVVVRLLCPTLGGLTGAQGDTKC